jgi:hypothetical protein
MQDPMPSEVPPAVLPGTPQHFPIPPERLVELAQQLFKVNSGVGDAALLTDDFRFEFPFISLSKDVRVAAVFLWLGVGDRWLLEPASNPVVRCSSLTRSNSFQVFLNQSASTASELSATCCEGVWHHCAGFYPNRQQLSAEGRIPQHGAEACTGLPRPNIFIITTWVRNAAGAGGAPLRLACGQV